MDLVLIDGGIICLKGFMKITNDIKCVSPSQLTMFDNCNRRWWASYILKIPKKPPTPAIIFGNVGHKILELSL